MPPSKPPDKGGTETSKNTGASDNKNSKKETYKTTFTVEVPKWLFYGTSVFFGFISIIVGSYLAYSQFAISDSREQILMNVGEEGVRLFEQHDRDQDGKLSLEEFEPFIYKLLENNVTGLSYEVPIEDDDQVITLRAHFDALRMETMTKDFSEQFVGGVDPFVGLRGWKTPSMEWMNFGARHFEVFLPPNPESVTLGDVYYIVGPRKFLTNTLSSNRYYPPRVEGTAIMIHRLLTLFHPRPFVVSRFAPQGSVACVRAMNRDYFDIYFRIHAEFQLNEPPYNPYWFTPAQFTGNIIMRRDSSEVLYFNMYVPTDRRLNVDMEWLNGPKESENMEVDIGFMPLMRLNNSAKSQPIPPEELYLKDVDQPESPTLSQDTDILWMSTIAAEDAIRVMEVQMYPFKKVPYFNFTTAFEKAEEDKKLVHSILLWGALDDQSC